MSDKNSSFESFEFIELARSFGFDNVCLVLRALERLEGIDEQYVASLSYPDRMRNVISTMKYNMRFQTRH